MLLRQLEYLTALAREGHFSRAAYVCHVSQPALSAGIRKLETELGVQIVRRGQRFDGFTPEGAEVLAWAQRILAERTELGHRLDAMRGGLTGTLRIGAIPTALSVSSLLTTSLREEHPMVRLSLESLTSREIVARLNDFDIDVGVTYVDGEPLGRVRVMPLYRERYLFLTHSDSELAGRHSLTWEEAGSVPLCLLHPGMQNRRIIEGYLTEAGVEVEPALETDAISAIYDHVTSLQLSSIIPHTWLHGFGLPEGVKVIPLPQPRRSFRVGLVLAGREPESMLGRALVETAGRIDMRRELDLALTRRLSAESPPGLAAGHRPDLDKRS